MVGFPYNYGDDLTVEESCERLVGISNIFIKGFARGFTTGFVVYGAAKIFTLSAFAEDTHVNVPPKPESPPKPPKVTSAETGALSAACGTICVIAANTGSFWVGFACAACVIAGMGIANANR